MNNPCKNCEFYDRRFREPINFVICSNCEKRQKYLAYLESKRKYRKGECIKTISDFQKHITDDKFVYYRDKITHAGWICSWQYSRIVNAMQAGVIFAAIRKDKEEQDV